MSDNIKFIWETSGGNRLAVFGNSMAGGQYWELRAFKNHVLQETRKTSGDLMEELRDLANLYIL